MEEKTRILNTKQINQKIERIAFQIYETHSDETELVLAGIADNGFTFAKKLQKQLQAISSLTTSLCEVSIDKKNPLSQIKTSLESAVYRKKNIVLVDDVLNSGATLIYGVKHFLEVELKQLHTAVLIDRSHKQFPVKADFKGISLSTSLHEHVEVVFDKDDHYAVLY